MKGVFFLLGIFWGEINFAQTKTSTFKRVIDAELLR
jgi:hypothetical protein